MVSESVRDRRGEAPPPITRRAALAAITAAASALVAAACAPPAGPATTSATPSVGTLAERYVRLALQMAKHQPSLVDAWLGAPEWAAGARRPAGELDRDLAALGEALAALTPGDHDGRRRVAYLRGQARALSIAAGRLLGRSPSFHDEAVGSFGYEPPARDAAALDAIRGELDGLLPGRGPLVSRYAAFRSAHAVPPAQVEAVFAAAVTWCRTHSAADLPLPDGESMSVGATDGEGWAGFSRPRDARTTDVWASRAGHVDVAHLLQLAAHEGIPGHHAQHVLAASALVEARGWHERALHPAFGPHRLLAEGAAEVAADRLLPLETRIALCRDTLLPIAGQRRADAGRLVRVERLASMLDVEIAHIAADYLSTSMTTEAVTTRLRDQALSLEPGAMMSFIEKQRTRVLAYPLGRAVVGRAVAEAPADARWTRLGEIATFFTLA